MTEINCNDDYEAGCNGLKDGWACNKESGTEVHASEVRKNDGPFICHSCLSDAIHRCCAEKKDHFAHHARLTPIVNAQESKIHKLCKETIYDELSRKFTEHPWVCDEVRIKENQVKKLPALQPDIGGRINNQRVAIEIQTSALTIPQILKRTLGYSGRDISILWIVPLTEPIGEEIFRPRLFERYLHSIYFGRVYYWLPEYGCNVLPVHFSIASREIPYSEWFEDGEQREGGGYYRPYKRIRRPVPLRPISIAETFHHRHRSEHRPWNERKIVPAMKILMDQEPIWWDKNEQYLLDRCYPEEPLSENY